MSVTFDAAVALQHSSHIRAMCCWSANRVSERLHGLLQGTESKKEGEEDPHPRIRNSAGVCLEVEPNPNLELTVDVGASTRKLQCFQTTLNGGSRDTIGYLASRTGDVGRGIVVEVCGSKSSVQRLRASCC